MIILSLELIRYKRFALNSIDYFKIIPTELVQLILGTNGCGKSSLIRELTPLPPDSNDFFKDGSKTIALTNHGNTYLLVTTFSPSTKHSFIKNDEELNPGGTVTVFKELVRQEFGITTEIHDVLIGDEVFHAMSPSRRREWFTRLSDTSYDYALLVYNRLKERSRDTSGALKLAKKHFVTESAKVISEAEEIKLRKDVDLTHSELNFLIERSAPIDKPICEYENDQRIKLEELSKMSSKLLRMRCVAPYGTHPYGLDPEGRSEYDEWGDRIQQGFRSTSEIDILVNTLNHKVTGAEVMLNLKITEHSKILETVTVLKRTGEDGVKSLHDKVNRLRVLRDNALSSRKLKIEGIDINNAVSAFNTIYDIISAVSMTIPENSDKKYSQVKLNELSDVLINKKNLKLLIISDIAKLNNRRVHLESHKTNNNLICPNCNHKWIPGYSEEHLDSLISELDKKDKEHNALDKEIETLEFEIDGIKEYGVQYKDYARCISNWPILRPLWDYLGESNYIINSPRIITSILDTFRIDLDYELTASKLNIEISELFDLIKLTEDIGDANLFELQSKLEICTDDIDRITSELNKLHGKVSSYNHYKKQLNDSIDLSNKITMLVTNVEAVNADMIEMLRRDTLNHCVKQLQSSLALKETVLNTAILQKGIVTDLDKQIKRLTIEEEAAKLLVKNLSPTDGLIAEGLFGFIKNFTRQMNALIKKIWSYPLQVQDCSVSSSELDYKFPLRTKENTVSDIKLGSTGMREVVNLAFKVIAMRYLGLSNSPLYLDEFGHSFDEVHRVNASITIKSLMETQHFTQLFMVSHYQSSHGGFTNAETCVLDPNNVTCPDTYNKHVTIC
jgi:energy-coupling factor transporter ATP-binding protein EcfA2